jgi:hypothetical protein
MNKLVLIFAGIGLNFNSFAQTNPAITSFLLNTTGIKGRHYLTGNSTPIQDADSANVQKIQYSASFAYIRASGIPAYVIGPYTNNPVPVASKQNRLYKIPLNPVEKIGTKTSVGPGRNGIFINGVPFFNAGDGRSYLNQNKWRNNAYVFEKNGIDCNRGHPEVQGTYHHHFNPSAFNVASIVSSTICNPYLGDGLYVPDSTKHGPLIGFAFDGFPVYGGFGHSSPLDTTSPIKRIKPSYRLRNITARTTLPDGTAATGPAINANIQNPGAVIVAVLGAYKEDFEYIAGSGDLDESNGRFCITKEYPNGIYCYFATLGADGNPVYPYLTGPTYYGVVETSNTQPAGASIAEPISTYTPMVTSNSSEESTGLKINIYPNPANDVLMVQLASPNALDRKVELISIEGKVVKTETLRQGSTMCYFDTQSLRKGIYFIRIHSKQTSISRKVMISE